MANVSVPTVLCGWEDLLARVEALEANGGGGNPNVTSESIGQTVAHGRVAANGTNIYMRNASAVRLSAGLYQITLSPNLSGPYALTLTASEDLANRDGRIIQYVPGTLLGSGFQVQILTGDNGTAADPQVDEEWMFAVHQSTTVVTSVT